MNYSENPGHVRVDRFKPAGKWYDTWVIDMSNYYNMDAGKSAIDGITLPPTWLAVETAILDELYARAKQFNNSYAMAIETFKHWNWVCLIPYHRYEHPIMFTVIKE